MLLKAALEAKKVPVFDKRSGKSISLESAIRKCQQAEGIKLSDEEAGSIRCAGLLARRGTALARGRGRRSALSVRPDSGDPLR